MSTEETQEVSLDDVLDAATAGQGTSQEATTETALPAVPEGAIQPEPFELPAYAKRWNADARKALETLASHADHRPHLDPLLKQYEEANKFIGQRDNELGELRKRFDPLWEVLGPLEQQYNLQGMSLQQGVTQMVNAVRFLAQSPDQAFPWIAQAYRPREAAKVVQALAQQWGVDLSAASQDAPYIDPSVQAMVQPIQQELQQLRSWRQQQESQTRTSQQTALVEAIRAFEAETDDNGNPKHPYLADVFDRMVGLAQAGLIKSSTPKEAIAEAYQLACRMDDTIQQRMADEKAKAAEEKARKEAAARTAAANKTAEAAKTVTGKGKGGGKAKAMSLDEAIDAASAELSAKS